MNATGAPNVSVLRLEPDLLAGRKARSWAGPIFGGTPFLVGRVDDALLVLSELVTNAVAYGRPPVTIVLHRSDDQLEIRVSDATAREVAVVHRSGPGGFGMRIVDAIADSWDVIPEPEGKTVVARFHR